jgi:hypothetical protein
MNKIPISFIKGGLKVIWAYVSSAGSTETVLRVFIASLLEEFMVVLPREVRESFISQATLAVLTAKDKDHAELEITAILADITEWIKENVK